MSDIGTPNLDDKEEVDRYAPQSILEQLLHRARKREGSAIPPSENAQKRELERRPLALRRIDFGLRMNHEYR